MNLIICHEHGKKNNNKKSKKIEGRSHFFDD